MDGPERDGRARRLTGIALQTVLDALQARMRMRQIPGLSLRVARHGKLLFGHELGVSDPASGESLTPAHVFRLGCLTKPITAYAVLQLAGEGRLGLDDLVVHHIAALATAPALRGITLAHLLSHTAGLARGPYAAPLASDADMLRQIAAAPLLFAPGTRFKYSNWGYYLLGKIMENLSGQGAGACIAQQVLAPLEMRDSGFSEAGRKLARGHWNGWYFGCPDLAEPSAPAPHTPLPDAAGGMLSTADDYLRWLLHVVGQGGEPMRSPRRRLGRNASTCFGLFMETIGDASFYHFSGSSSGFSGFMLLVPALGLSGVALCNHGACTSELREMLYLACRASVATLPGFGQADARHDVLAGNRRELLRFISGPGQAAQLIRNGQPVRLWRHSRSAYFLCDGAQRRHMLRLSGLADPAHGDAVLTLGSVVFYQRLSRLRSVAAAAGAWDAWAGVYRHAVFGKVELICRQGQLHLSYGAAYECALEHLDGLRFRQAPGAFCFETIDLQTDPATGAPLSFLLNQMLFLRSPTHDDST